MFNSRLIEIWYWITRCCDAWAIELFHRSIVPISGGEKNAQIECKNNYFHIEWQGQPDSTQQTELGINKLIPQFNDSKPRGLKVNTYYKKGFTEKRMKKPE